MTIDELKTKYIIEMTDIKSILEITDTTQDTVIIFAIDKAYRAILKYTGWTEFNSDYVSAVYSLAIAYYNNDINKNKLAKGERVITQQSQGSRSTTYSNSTISIDRNGLTEDVKAMLPLPKVRCY